MWDYEDNSVFLHPEFTTLHHHLYELERASYHVGKSIFSGWRKYLLRLEKVSFWVQGSIFSIAATRLGSSAEPSQQVC